MDRKYSRIGISGHTTSITIKDSYFSIFLFFFYMYSQLLFFKLCEIDVYCYFLQTATSVLYVNWESFQDVEEFKTNSHASGIQNYKLGIGINHFFPY